MPVRRLVRVELGVASVRLISIVAVRKDQKSEVSVIGLTRQRTTERTVAFSSSNINMTAAKLYYLENIRSQD